MLISGIYAIFHPSPSQTRHDARYLQKSFHSQDIFITYITYFHDYMPLVNTIRLTTYFTA